MVTPMRSTRSHARQYRAGRRAGAQRTLVAQSFASGKRRSNVTAVGAFASSAAADDRWSDWRAGVWKPRCDRRGPIRAFMSRRTGRSPPRRTRRRAGRLCRQESRPRSNQPARSKSSSMCLRYLYSFCDKTTTVLLEIIPVSSIIIQPFIFVSSCGQTQFW
jgi:hypothetical protein